MAQISSEMLEELPSIFHNFKGYFLFGEAHHFFQKYMEKSIGKTPQIPSVSVFCNPGTVDLTCTFQEQLIVVEEQFLAAQNKNSISQAAQKNLSS